MLQLLHLQLENFTVSKQADFNIPLNTKYVTSKTSLSRPLISLVLTNQSTQCLQTIFWSGWDTHYVRKSTYITKAISKTNAENTNDKCLDTMKSSSRPCTGRRKDQEEVHRNQTREGSGWLPLLQSLPLPAASANTEGKDIRQNPQMEELQQK